MCDRFVPAPSDVSLSYDLIWRAPRRLGPDAVVFVASYSGQTEDTLAALRFARSAARAPSRSSASPTR